MSQLQLTDIKRFCEALDFTDDDDLLEGLWGAAEEFVQSYTRRDLDTDLPGNWPQACTLAVQMLVRHWYEHRGSSGANGEHKVPFSVRDLLANERDLS